jgi:hypothetical protein
MLQELQRRCQHFRRLAVFCKYSYNTVVYYALGINKLLEGVYVYDVDGIHRCHIRVWPGCLSQSQILNLGIETGLSTSC